jgi:putative lipoprotein
MRWILLVVIMLLAACAPAGSVEPTTLPDGDVNIPSTSGTDLVGTRWRLDSIGAPGAEVAITGSEVTLNFDADGQAGGSGGCNSFGAQYSVQNGTIQFDEVVSTLMACADAQVNEQETLFLRALDAASQYELDGDTLRILYDNGSAILNFVRASN